MQSIGKFSLALLAVLAFGASSARAEAPVRNVGFPVLDFVVDVNGAPITPASDPATKLYNARFCDEHPPILAPDGHQLTLGEWLTLQGRASVKCINKGTHVEIELSGLIPNGVYSIWDIRLDEDSNLVGAGSLGRNDGSQNHFQATASAHGEVSVVMAGGPLSIFGDADECQLDEAQLILFVVYHLDQQTHGPVPGPIPGCTFCEQFGFLFKP